MMKEKKNITFTLIDNSVSRKLKDILNELNLDRLKHTRYTNMCIYSDPSK